MNIKKNRISKGTKRFIIDFNRFPMPRDFGYSIKCLNTTCPYHDKGSHCSSSSIVLINETGKCKPYSDYMVNKTNLGI